MEIAGDLVADLHKGKNFAIPHHLWVWDCIYILFMYDIIAFG